MRSEYVRFAGHKDNFFEVSFVVNNDKKRAVALLKSDSGNVAKLVELPTRKVLKEIRADVFSGSTSATAQRRVGLADERLRIAQADVAVAKKPKPCAKPRPR